MAEIQLTRIRSLYGDVKGLLSQIPLPEQDSMVKEFVVEQYNEVVNKLSVQTSTDYSTYSIPDSQRVDDWPEMYPSTIVRAQIGRIIARLEEEYGFNNTNNSSAPTIAIFNKNNNTNTIEINFTIEDLIRKTSDEQNKEKLTELKYELEKPTKDWDKIKPILIWLINASKDLFIQVVAILLEKKI